VGSDGEGRGWEASRGSHREEGRASAGHCAESRERRGARLVRGGMVVRVKEGL